MTVCACVHAVYYDGCVAYCVSLFSSRVLVAARGGFKAHATALYSLSLYSVPLRMTLHLRGESVPWEVGWWFFLLRFRSAALYLYLLISTVSHFLLSFFSFSFFQSSNFFFRARSLAEIFSLIFGDRQDKQADIPLRF